MRILSFGWTSDRLLSGRKTVTRRKWKRAWVKKGELVQAWSKGPHRGGRKLGILRILNVNIEYWRHDTFLHDHEAQREGFLNWQEFKRMIQDDKSKCLLGTIWRIEFEPVGELK
jgi:hypothetical protein